MKKKIKQGRGNQTFQRKVQVGGWSRKASPKGMREPWGSLENVFPAEGTASAKALRQKLV